MNRVEDWQGEFRVDRVEGVWSLGLIGLKGYVYGVEGLGSIAIGFRVIVFGT